jgi:hypothetical protein
VSFLGPALLVLDALDFDFAGAFFLIVLAAGFGDLDLDAAPFFGAFFLAAGFFLGIAFLGLAVLFFDVFFFVAISVTFICIEVLNKIESRCLS